VALVLAACAPGGEYVKGERGGTAGGVDRGETNGRMFDFISNLPEGEDWQIRLRDNSLWAAYSDGDDVADLGTKALSDKDASKLWDLVDAIDIAGRKKGRPDEDEGWVELRLREPGDDHHDIFKIFVSRADAEDDDEVLALAAHLQKLIEKYFKKKPEF
jgi:hypothetical protein